MLLRTNSALSWGTRSIRTIITTSTDRKGECRISELWSFHQICAPRCVGTRLAGRSRVSEPFFHITSHHIVLSRIVGFETAMLCLASGFKPPNSSNCLNNLPPREIVLISKRPGDTEGGSEKSLPSLETRLMTLKGSFQSYTSLDDMDDNY